MKFFIFLAVSMVLAQRDLDTGSSKKKSILQIYFLLDNAKRIVDYQYIFSYKGQFANGMPQFL